MNTNLAEQESSALVRNNVTAHYDGALAPGSGSG